MDRPCEQYGFMPHKPHPYKIAPTEPPDAYYCPGWDRSLQGVVQAPEPNMHVETHDGTVVASFHQHEYEVLVRADDSPHAVTCYCGETWEVR
jgi:hypothetical protein